MADASSCTVLVLDDDEELRAFLRSLLAPIGYTVREASRLDEARQEISRTPIDIAIIDGLLPDGNGIELIAELRQNGSKLRVIFMSAYWRDLRTYRKLTQDLQVDRVINKPFLAREFLMQLESIQSPACAETRAATLAAAEQHAEEERLEEQLTSLRQQFTHRLESRVQELQGSFHEARSSHDAPRPLRRLCQLAHRLHGTAGAYGLFDIAAAAGSIEGVLTEVSGGRVPASEAVWRDVERSLEKLQSAHRRHRALLTAAEPKVGPVRYDLRLLVIDRDPAFRAEMVSLGRKNLVEVVPATDAADAARLARDWELDGALIGSTESSEYPSVEVAHTLREAKGQSRLPLAVVAADGAMANRVAAAYAGASLFLIKPVSQDRFASAVEYFRALKRAEQPRILVVDDDADFLDHVTAQLESQGMRVSQLADPSGVLEALGAVHPDLILLDVVMPGFSGYDVCKMLRATPEWQTIPILFLTARLDPAERLRCFEVGGDDYVPKPALAAELFARIRVRLERARLHQERENRDSLTGLLSRQALLRALETRLAENSRLTRPLALCLVDLDHFKEVNDRHGHLSGDKVLRALGQLLSSRFRTEDVRGRWGGEEFMVGFNGEGRDTAREMLGRVLSEFRDMQFTGDRGEPFGATFSAGVSVFPDDGFTLEQLIRAADRRLYDAKAEGRSRIIS